MFSREYQGESHKLFLRALDDYENIYNPKKHFGRIIPIIQSSGTGKSRMVREIGNEVRFPLTFVLRSNLETYRCQHSASASGKVHHPRVVGPPPTNQHAPFF